MEVTNLWHFPKKKRSDRAEMSEEEYLRSRGFEISQDEYLKSELSNRKPEKRPPLELDMQDHNKKQHGKKKKKKKKKITQAVQGPEPPPDLPENLKQVVQAMGGHELRLLIQKNITDSDVKKDQNRLSMPVNQIRGEDDFLTEEEAGNVVRKKEKRVQGIPVTLVEPSSRQKELSLRKWDFGGSISYVLAGDWYNVTERIGLKVNDRVQIWFFRSESREPCFLLVKLTVENSTSSIPQENQGTDTTQPSSSAVATAPC